MHDFCTAVWQIEVQEVDRLAAVVYTIQQESAVAPKGAYIQTETGAVVRNDSFHGLSLSEASRLGYYLHFSPRVSSATSNVCAHHEEPAVMTLPFLTGHSQALSLPGYDRHRHTTGWVMYSMAVIHIHVCELM